MNPPPPPHCLPLWQQITFPFLFAIPFTFPNNLMIMATGRSFPLFSHHESHRRLLHTGEIQTIWQITPKASLMSRAYSWLFQISNQSGCQVSGELRLSILDEWFMLFSSQLFGCIWLGEVWGWPNGEATWRLQMFCFCICTAHQKQQAVPPYSPCHLGGTRQQLPWWITGELLFFCKMCQWSSYFQAPPDIIYSIHPV